MSSPLITSSFVTLLPVILILSTKFLGPSKMFKVILIDSSLSRYENVYAAAGHPNSIFKITYKQLVKLTKGKEEDIV